MKRRYFGVSELRLHGGVFAPGAPERCFLVELVGPSGEVYGQTRADGPSLKPGEMPDGHGFSLPVPAEWFSAETRPEWFQFRIVETGQQFPNEPREIPVWSLVNAVNWKREVRSELGRKMQRHTKALRERQPAKGDLLVVGTHALTRTGAPMIILELVRRLRARRDVDVLLLCSGPWGPLYEAFRECRVDIVEELDEAAEAAPRETAEFFTALGQVAKVGDRRLALINSLCATDLATRCREAGLQVFSLIHEYPYAFEKERIWRHFEVSADVVFPCRDVSRRFAEVLGREGRSGLKETRFSILPQGCYQMEWEPVDTAASAALVERVRKENFLGPRDRLVVCCGTIESRKGFDWLTRFVRYYHGHSPHAPRTHFLWVGAIGQHDLYEHGLHDLRRDGVIGHFHHCDEMEDVRPVMGMADAFLLCSRIDPFPSVVLEAFLAGVPVIGFDRDQGCAEMIVETGFGRVVPYQSLEAAGRALDGLLAADSVETKAVRELGAAYVGKHYRFQDYADRIAGALLNGAALPGAAGFSPRTAGEKRELPGREHKTEGSIPVDDAGRKRHAISLALEFLERAQLPDGEFRTLISTRPSLEEGEWDSSPFVTALVAQALEALPGAEAMLGRALSFLETQMEPGGVWRYYTAKQFKHSRIPPDLDDTSCAAFVLKRRRGQAVPENEWIFEALRSPEGLYYTWLLPEEGHSPEFTAYLNTLDTLAEAKAPPMPPEKAVSGRFAEPRDPVTAREVDPVVNANVLLYLGEGERTRAVVDYLVRLVQRPGLNGDLGAYYTDEIALYYMMARAAKHAAPGLKTAKEPVRERLEKRLAQLSEEGPEAAMLTAMAACALWCFAPESEALGAALERLIGWQGPDGSWPRAAFYRGPAEFWGSEELTTAFCLEALAGNDLPENPPAAPSGLDVDEESRPEEFASGGKVTLDFSDAGFRWNPYPQMKALREEAPVSFDENLQVWLVSRYEDCARVLNDPATFSTRGHSFESTLMGADGEAHEKVRALMRGFFEPERLGKLEEKIEGWTDEMLSALESQGTGDFIQGLALLLPTWVVTELMGLDRETADRLPRWIEMLLSGTELEQEALEPEELAARVSECREYFHHEIELCKDEREERGLISFLSGSDELSEEAKVDLCLLVMAAGVVTTRNLVANAVVLLAAREDLKRALREDPGAMPGFLDEVLRYESPVQHVSRAVVAPVELGGQSIAAGDTVRVLIGSANRDEIKFEEPDTFHAGRRPNPHLAFGRGVHQCLGMLLARLEARIVIRRLLERYPDWRGAWPAGESPLRNHGFLRGPRKLPITLKPQPATRHEESMA